MLTKKSRGLRATGMGAVSCARHQLFRALGMGDLQKGERYALTLQTLSIYTHAQ
jgi:Kyakuja-Dileera-Zisupton transposase